MKSLNLAVMITSVVLLTSNLAQAKGQDHHNAHNQNFISKRPYHEPVKNHTDTSKTSDEFEGATLEREELDENERAAIRNLKVLRMNQLSRRPYQ